jgi:opacity protein-like surface antigen
MKQTLFTTALLMAITLTARAGTEMAPTSESKDMKQMTQANASDAGFYVAVYGGAQFDTDYGDNHQTFGGASTHTPIHSGWGGVGGIKGGYNFNSFPVGNFMSLRLQPALEAEALYIGDNSHSSGGFTGTTGQNFSSNSGDFFLNGILRFKNSSIVTPYIGVGAGVQYLTTHGSFNTVGGGQVTGLDTDDVDFAAQALFGLDVAVTSHISIFSEYKFIDALGTDGDASGPRGATYRFKPDQVEQNLITAGVKYSF